jgi:hypothetical protein
MAGVKFGKFVPESVLTEYGLHRKVSVETLVKEAQNFDVKNKGYLSRDEFEKAAESLSKSMAGTSTTATSGQFRYSRGLLKEVHQEYLRGNPNKTYTEAQLLDAAKAYDKGDHYLNRGELEAGAIDLQMGRDAKTLSGKLEKLWDDKEFPKALAKEPSTAKMRSFPVGLVASAMGDDIEAKAFVDTAKDRVLVQVKMTENLPWEGISSTDVKWYSVPFSDLR